MNEQREPATDLDAERFDDWTRDYSLLALRLDRLVPGFVDAWIGPAAWRETVAVEPQPAAESLRHEAESLVDRLPDMGYAARREEYLRRQVRAMSTTARLLAGEDLPFGEQVEGVFDIRPMRVPESTFEDAHRVLDGALGGAGSLRDRLIAWRESAAVPPERLSELLERVRAEVHERTRRILPLPDGEEVEIALVRDRPWTAFNWYLGRGRSRIEFNTDLPFRSFMAADIMAHEGYPGHHTEWVLRETRQYRERGEGEWASAILGPQSVIAEGIASCARSVIFDGDEDLRWLSGDVLPALGQQLDPEQAGAVRRAADILEGASDNAAFLLHEDHLPVEEVKAYLMHWRLSTAEEAEKRLQFLLSPLWRVYTFTYTYGERLLAPLLAGPHRLRTFERILTEPVYPELLTRWVTEEP